MPLPSHARSFTLSMRLLRNTNTSPQYGFVRSASLTSADSVCTDLRKSIGCVATTTLRSARSAITPRLAAPTAPSKASSHRPPARREDAPGSARARHNAGRVGPCRCRQLVSPHREQPTGNAIAARDLGNVGALLETLRYDPGLLLRRPPAPLALSRNHLDTTIRTAILPGIKHDICHRLSPNNQLMPGCIADQSRDREVGASCR